MADIVRYSRVGSRTPLVDSYAMVAIRVPTLGTVAQREHYDSLYIDHCRAQASHDSFEPRSKTALILSNVYPVDVGI
jgi:hypothetical protein